ncbi:MAG: glycine--tRNA ligase subunit beta [Elusimicrobia bacterium GWA2_61_42]|nr:MAG: glycine--tRNA ligase subunit beta [Elusimicrobia bacterium GWA2_61_42]OGR74143.1 MAG: glycine--tRNA ligase subunit beta [Elusimicrobia bacterium GWC2_61_25]
MLKRDALLEVRIENIPARFVTSAEEQLKKYAAELLAEANLPCEGIEACGTYKRLVLYISGVPSKTEERTQKAYGPAARLLRDAAGNFTPQAAGFARARGTTPDKLGVETVPNKGEVLVFESKVPGRPAVKALAELFPKAVARLQFPKNMVWEASRFRFARPIRSLLALYGDKPVAFSVAGVKSGRVTVGLSAKGSRPLKIASAEKYFKALEHANVIVKDADRLEALRREIERLSKRMKLEVEADPELLSENLYLVEYPVCVVDGYSQDFLKLPPELVHLVMKKQLKFFTVANAAGTLQPYFVGIRDGVSKGQRNVEEGFKNVLEARFRDAIFFYTRDLAVPLSDFKDKLGAVTFQAKLGTMADKTARVEKLAAWLCGNCGAAVNKEEVAAAAAHVYSDLTTNLVREFTELQGVMGYYYAKNSGMSERASRAVGEFYWPVSAKSPLPSSKEGALVSLAGKLDTLASDFALGLIPSGSEDPHGLRRQALGLVRIILENGLTINLKEAVSAAFAGLPPAAASRAVEPLLDFIWQRAEAVFTEAGYRFDEAKAVRDFFLAGGDLLDCRDRVRDINALRGNPDFAGIAMAFKRAKNILRQAKLPLSGTPDENSFKQDEERALYGGIKALSGRLAAHVAGRDYAKGLSELLSIKSSLDNFFEKVMVMAEDPKVRDNRLNLIKSLVNLFEGIADLSQLQ